MENKNVIIIIVAMVLILVVAAVVVGGFALGLFNSTAQFDESLKSAYASQGNLSDEVFDFDVDYESNSSVNKAVKTTESWQKDNDKTKGYLNTALEQTNNDTEKQYVNLLLEQNKIFDRILKIMTKMLKIYKDYNSGKIDATNAYTDVSEQTNKLTSISEDMEKNQEEIRDLLSDNPDLENRLKTLGIKDSFIGDSETS